MPATSPVEMLDHAVSLLVAEAPVELDGAEALARTRVLLVARERLQAAVLAAVRDVDQRELYALDAAGSTRGWRRGQLSGDCGQLGLARRLANRTLVAAALAAGQLSARASGQLCGALERVPDEVPEAAMVAVLTDGLAGLLAAHTGRELFDGVEPGPAWRAAAAELAQVSATGCATVTSPPAQRLEPAFLLLARHLPPGGLG